MIYFKILSNNNNYLVYVNIHNTEFVSISLNKKKITFGYHLKGLENAKPQEVIYIENLEEFITSRYDKNDYNY